MPALIPAVVAAGISGTVAVFTNAAFWGAAIKAFAATLVTGLLTKATTKKPDQQQQAFTVSQGQNITVREPVPSQKAIYGRVRAGGATTAVYLTQSNSAWNTVITLAGHPVQSIEDVLFDDYAGTFDSNGIETGRYSAGGVYAVVNRSLGDETGQPFPGLVAETGGLWGNTTHLQRGHAKLYARLFVSPALFPQGVPNLTAIVRGKKVYDPRTGLTAWSHNPALCLADYLCDTRFGLGVDYDEGIQEAALIAAANICDERVTLAGNTTGFTADATTDMLTLDAGSALPQVGDGVRFTTTGTLPGGLSAGVTYYAVPRAKTLQLATSYANAMAGTVLDISSAGSGVHTMTYYDEPRYTLNGVVNSADKPREIMGRMLAAMGGWAVRVGGKWHIYAGAYVAPTITLTADDLAGAVRVQTLVSRRELANGVKGVYTEPASLFQPNDFPPVLGTAYLAQDGGERLWRDIDLSSFVTRGTQSQRLAKIDLLRSRQGLTVTAEFKLSAWRCMAGGTVALTLERYGWTAKPFEVIGSRFVVADDGALGVELSLRETAAAVFDWSTSDESPIDIAPNTSFPPPSAPTAPGTPAVSEELYETTGSAGVKARAVVTWSAPLGVTVLGYELQFKLAADADWIARPFTTAAEDLVDDLAPGLYQFRVRLVNIVGAVSAWSPTASRQLLGLTAPPATPTGFSVIKSEGFGLAQWSRSPDLDVQINGKAVVRHSPLLVGAEWEDGVIVDDFPGGSVQGLVPLMTGTYMLKHQDSSENWSSGFASYVATEGMVTSFNTVGSVTEHTAFTGAKTNVAFDAGYGGIKLDGLTTIDSMVTNIDSWPFIDSLGGISATGSYAFAGTLDLSTVATRRFESDIQALSFDTGDTIDNRLDNIDTWDSIDGAAVNGCDVTLYGRFTNDNPAGSPVWGPWTPFFVADFTARAAQFKLDFVSANAQHNIVVTQLAVAAKIPA